MNWHLPIIAAVGRQKQEDQMVQAGHPQLCSVLKVRLITTCNPLSKDKRERNEHSNNIIIQPIDDIEPSSIVTPIDHFHHEDVL